MTASRQNRLQNQAASSGWASLAAGGIQHLTNMAASMAQVSLVTSTSVHNTQMGTTGTSTTNTCQASAINTSTQGHGAGQQFYGHQNYGQNPSPYGMNGPAHFGPYQFTGNVGQNSYMKKLAF